MSVDIVIPTVGESINEANIGRFIVPAGGWAEQGEPVLEIETDKASMEVMAPESGVVSYSVGEGDLVAIGAAVGSVDTSAEKPADATPAASSDAPAEKKEAAVATPAASSSTPTVDESLLKGLGPAKRKAIREGRASLPSTGGGHNLQEDSNTGVERKPMSVMRKKIAERLLHSQHSTASLTTFNEVDMTNVLGTRGALKAEFEKKHGIKLGFMSYFTKAVCYAVEHVPIVNAQIDGTDVIHNENVHVSIAVSTDRGLVVPVLRNANKLDFAGVEKGIAEMAGRARDGKLGIEDMMGGTYTITNGGVFGSLVSTPILNPPQTAILGMHKTEQRPIAVDDGSGQLKVEIRPMMYLAMTYDHRLIDGKDSVTFLVKVKEFLENVTEDQVL